MSLNEFGTAIILAGGKSSRMGFDKQFIMIDNKTIVDLIVEKLRNRFSDIIVVTNKKECYTDKNVILTSDLIPNRGPLSGIHAGLVKSNSKFNFVIGCDMPNINLRYIDYMVGKIENTDYKGCITKLEDWIEPMYAFYSKDLVKDIETYLSNNKRAIFPFLKEQNIYYVEEEQARKYSENWEIFQNLNTKEDLEKYKSAL